MSLVEKRSKEAAEAKKSEMRDWNQSSKSQKTVASMIVDKNSNTTTGSTSNGKKASSEPSKVTPEEAETTKADLDEETRLANLSKLAAKKKKGPAPFTPKSPKMNKTPKAACGRIVMDCMRGRSGPMFFTLRHASRVSFFTLRSLTEKGAELRPLVS